MGLIDRLAKAVADNINKSSINLPAGAVTMTEQQMRDASVSASYGQQTPLPRNPILAGVPFGPGSPILPGAINPLREDGRPDPRRYEYQVAQNINIATEQKLVPFKTLRGAAEQIDIVRRCVEVLKSKIAGLDWDIVIAEDASEKIISEIGGDHVRAMSKARDKFSEDIYRLREFWENPDRANGLTFIDWMMMSLEEILVLDAWAIWPQRTVGGDLYGFQILDGATIKPLLDERGMRPMPPQAAYQQILYGFPRSEFTANSDSPEADGEFTADDLSYFIRNRRANSVYGSSPVERCLPLADLYLRRQQWLRAEYTDGVTPEMMLTSDADFGNDPLVMRQYENIINDNLAGQTEQRKRALILPAGLKPEFYEGYGEKFKAALDEYLITSITGHFGVLPTEIGFSQKGGLGSSGHQEGEAEAAQNIGVAPLAQWISKMLSNISYTYLGMPRELEFKFMISEVRDNEQMAKKADLEMRGGTKTINERRSELGLPLLDTPAADQPILVAGNGVFIFSPDGIVNAASPTAGTDFADNDNNPMAPATPPAEPVTPVEASQPSQPSSAAPKEPVKAVNKYNENHDERGRFSSGDSSGMTSSGNIPQGRDNGTISAAKDTIQAVKDNLDNHLETMRAVDPEGHAERVEVVNDAKASLDQASRWLDRANTATDNATHADYASRAADHIDQAGRDMETGPSQTIVNTGDNMRSFASRLDQYATNVGGKKSADLDKAGVPSIAEAEAALSRLEVLPNPAGNAVEVDESPHDFVESPWEVTDTIAVDPDVWTKAQLTLVTIKDLIGTDTVLKREKVADRINAMGQSLRPYHNYPLVYDDGEKQVIIDGHHRLMAMWLLGMEQAPVWLGKPDLAAEAAEEVKKFLAWADRPWSRARQFQFKALDTIVADALNRCYFDNDLDTMRSLAKAYLK